MYWVPHLWPNCVLQLPLLPGSYKRGSHMFNRIVMLGRIVWRGICAKTKHHRKCQLYCNRSVEV